jgi:sulfate adenylyltransferase
MIEPHGGRLVDRVVDDRQASRIRESTADQPTIRLDSDDVQDVYNVATGRFSPLKGFLSQNDFLKVVKDMTLEDGTVWPLPVVLDVDAETAAELTPDTTARLVAPDDVTIGVIDIDEVYKYNREESAESIFGTNDREHPGVRNFIAQDEFLVGGDVRVFGDNAYTEYDLIPAESRVLFRHLGWDEVVGFQTRNAPHRAHEYLQKSALEHVDGLFIQPKLGVKKSGDYRDDVIMGAYRTLIDNYYPRKRVAFSVFPSRMRYAGPREAVFDALVRKNQGCTHFIVGRDHAGVEDYYSGFDAHRVFDDIDVGVEPIFFSYSFFCIRCDSMASERVCPHPDDERVYPSGSDIRRTIKDGGRPSGRVMRPEVATFILEAEEPFIP